MTIFSIPVRSSLSVAVLAVVLAACSGGGSGSLNDGLNDGSPDVGSGAPFVGRMVGSRRFDNSLLAVDLSTGRYQSLPGNDHLASFGVLRDDAFVRTRRDRSIPSGMMITVDDCFEERDETICFFFLDRDGNLTSQFGFDGRSPGPGKVSFDGSHVAVNLTDREGGSSVMTLYTREGEFVSSHAQSGGMQNMGPYDWLPDGRLVYSIEGNELLGDVQSTGFFITDPFDAAPQRRIVLSDFYQGGTIYSIESSPDGSQLLINIEPRVGPRRPILINTETLSSSTQLIDRAQASPIDVKSAVWGPEGRWVYAVVSSSDLLSGPALDSSQGESIVFIGTSDSLFAYEVNGITHPMPVSQGELSDSVRLIPTDNPSNPGGQVGAGEYDGNLVWIP